jgi:hypothetical protein
MTRAHKESEPGLTRRGIFSSLLPFAVPAVLCIGVAAYTASHVDGIDRSAALGITGASALAAVWNLIALWRYQKSGLREYRLAVAFSAIVAAALVAFTAVTYAGIGPFADAGGASNPGNTTGSPTATPTPAPEGIRQTRQDRGLRASIDAACLTPGNSVSIDMTIRNVGNSTLTIAGFRFLPQNEAVVSPADDPAHPCHDGIPPGEGCLFRYSDGTQLELRPSDLTVETYLVLQCEDATGGKYGLTFTLPPAERMPRCG